MKARLSLLALRYCWLPEARISRRKSSDDTVNWSTSLGQHGIDRMPTTINRSISSCIFLLTGRVLM
jgi:hypothetical protein